MRLDPLFSNRLVSAGGVGIKSGKGAKARLVGSYGAGVTPERAASPIGVAEGAALNSLYAHQTGGANLADHPDKSVALRSAGLLHGGHAAGLGRVKHGGGDVFASAADALDAVLHGTDPIDKKIGEGLSWYRKKVEAKHPEVKTGQFPSFSVGQLLDPYKRAVENKNPELRKDVGGPSFSNILNAYRGAVEAKHPELNVRPEATLPQVIMGGLGAYRRAVEAKHPELPKKETGISGLPGGSFLNFGSPFTPAEEENLKRLGGKVTGTHLGGLVQTYEIPGYKLGDMMNQADPVRSAISSTQLAAIGVTAQNLISSQATDEAKNAMAEFLTAAAEGKPAVEIDAIQRNSSLGPLSRYQRKDMLDLAKANGWEIANPRLYTDAELTRRAFQKSNGEWLWTGLYRGVAGLASLPAFLAAAIEVSVDAAQGDSDPAKRFIREAIAPFTYYAGDVQRRGVKAATESFVKERPFDALTIVNGAIRSAGRSAAIGMRTLGGTGKTLPQQFVTSALGKPAEGSFRQRMGQYAEVNRPIEATISGPYKTTVAERLPEGAAMETPEGISVGVGVTGKNVLDTLFLGMRAWMYKRAVESGGESRVAGFASRGVQKSVERRIRNAATRRDVASARATRALTELARTITPAQRERLGMELLRGVQDFEGIGLSLADAAKFWANRASEEAARIAGETDKARVIDLRSNSKLYNDMAEMYQRLADTPLDQAIIDQAKALAEPLGKNNDLYVGSIIEALTPGAAGGIKIINTIVDEVTGVSRALTMKDLKPGDYIDPARIGRKIGNTETEVPRSPAVITRILYSDRGVRVEYKDVGTGRVGAVTRDYGQRANRLSSGVTASRYIRDFFMLDEQLNALAKARVAGQRLAAKLQARELNKPLDRLESLDARRQTIGRQLRDIAQKMEEARASGNAARVRSLTRQYSMKAYLLRGVLVEMEKEARAKGMVELADWAKGRLDEIKIERGDLGGRVYGAAAERQAGLVDAVERSSAPEIVSRFIEQPRAVELVGRATRLEARAAELRRIEEQLIAERAAAPTASAAARASKRLDEIRQEIDSLVQMSGEARTTPVGFASALASLEARYDYLLSSPFGEALPATSKWTAKFNEARPGILRTLGDLRARLDDGELIRKEDLVALKKAESEIVALERRARSSKKYKSTNEPAGFGTRVASAGVDMKRQVPRELRDQAFAKAESMTPLEQRVAAREAAPSRATITEVRRARKRAEKLAARNRREAARIVERGRPLVVDKNMRVVIDAATGQIAVDLKVGRVQPVRFKIEQARNEVKEEYIARAEMAGEGPLLWLGTRQATFGASRTATRLESQLDVGPGAGLSRNRFLENRGVVYGEGKESFANIWNRLIRDTGSIAGNAAWIEEMQRFLEAIGIKVTNMTEKEAEAYNQAFAGANVEITSAEGVVFNARNWVAVSADRRYGISNVIKTGNITDEIANQIVDDLKSPDTTLSDLFTRIATVDKVANAGGNYYLIPRVLYEQVTRELAEIQWTPTSKSLSFLDKITKQWRAFTLNIFPRTGMANLVGSAILAATAGAGPRSFYLAYRHLMYGDVAAPAQLRQGYGAMLSSEVDFARLRNALPSGSIRLPGYPSRFVPGVGREISFDTPLAGLAYWMNTMRRFNGVAEDFGRLAVWYSKAYPAASHYAGHSWWKTITTGRKLSDEAQAVLESFARGDDANTAAIAQSFVDHSFEWLGDLHAGGKANTILRIAIPFQQWYRHIIRLTLVTMPLKYPGRTLFLQRLGDIGREYLHKHHVMPSWMMDVIPILIDEKMVDGIPQEYILGWHAGTLNPYGTPAGAVSGEDQQISDWAAGMLNPLVRVAAELGWSFVQGGKAQKMGGRGVFEPVKNQANNNIQLFNSDGGSWFLNEVQRTLPLSSMAISSSGQAAESNFFFNEKQRLFRGAEGFMPAYVVPPDAPGKDVAQIASSFSWWNAVALTGRMLVGGSFGYSIGRGPVEDSQFAAYFNNVRSDYMKYMRNLEKSQYQASLTENPAGVSVEPVQQAPVSTPEPAPTPEVPAATDLRDVFSTPLG